MAKTEKKKTAKKPAATVKGKPRQREYKARGENRDWPAEFEMVCGKIDEGMAVRKAVVGIMSPKKFFELMNENPVLLKRYQFATDLRAEEIVEDIINIADDRSHDVYIDADGNRRTDSGAVQRSRLQVDTRKWQVEKLAPKKYGPKVAVDHTNNGEKFEKESIDWGQVPVESLRAILAATSKPDES